MIIFRYINRQILQTTAAVTLVLMVVAISSRFIQFLAEAVEGAISSEVLVQLIGYRLPDLLLVVVPLAYFVSIMMVFGRMYVENEMVILQGSGMGRTRLLLISLGSASIITIFTAALSLYLAPSGLRAVEALLQNQQQLTEIDLIVPGQFQEFGEGNRVTYAENIENDEKLGKVPQNLFISIATQNPGDNSSQIVLAKTGRAEILDNTELRFMRLEGVRQYVGIPGEKDYKVAFSDTLSILLPTPAPMEEIDEVFTLATADLIESNLPTHIAELQWRLSMIFLVPILSLIAIPMSRVNPRQGRYAKLIPAILLYSSYFILLQYSRDRVAQGNSDPGVGMIWVHLLFLVLAIVMFNSEKMMRLIIRRHSEYPNPNG